MSNPYILKAVTAMSVPQGAVAEGPGQPKETRPARPWPRRNRRGVGVFGVILGIAVTAGAILGLIALYQGAVNNTRTQTTLNTALIMDTSIRRAYANLPQFEDELTAGLLSAVPSSSVQNGHTASPGGLPTGEGRRIVTPWGGFMFAGGGDTPDDDGSGAASPNRFYISILNLPETACEAIAAAFLNRPDVVGLVVEGAGGTAFTQVNTATQIQAFDTVAEINDECNGGDDDKVAIVFRG